MIKTSRQIGFEKEQLAKNFLKNENLTIVQSNYSSKYGEIDIICKQNSMWIFVEVKYRKNKKYGDARYAITKHKQQKIILTTQDFFIKNNININNALIRFDALIMEGINNDITWLKNAFGEN